MVTGLVRNQKCRARFSFRLAHNTAAAIQGLEYIYIYGPILFVMLGGACFIGWTLDAKRHGEIRQALDIRDAALGEAAVIAGLTGQPAPAPGE